MNIEELLKQEPTYIIAVISVLAGALVTWVAAKYYVIPPLDIKLKQAKRYRRTSFGEISNLTKLVGLTERIDSPLGTFVMNGNGTITDCNNKIMWIQARWGMTWDGDRFIGDPIRVNWWDATWLFGKGVILGYPVGTLNDKHLEQSRLENGYTKGKCVVSFAGYHDWRLPTAFEISTLGFFDPTKKLEGYEYTSSQYTPLAKSLREKLFPNLDGLTGNYWLWCAHEQGSGFSWAVDSNWLPGDFKSSDCYYILLVRSL